MVIVALLPQPAALEGSGGGRKQYKKDSKHI